MSDKQARGYGVPCIKALMLHLLVFGLFIFNWESVEQHPVMVQPVIVQAQVLVMKDPIAERNKEADKRKVEDARKAKERRKAQKKRKAEAARKAQEKRKAEDARKKAENKRKAEQQLAEQRRKKADADKNRELDISQALSDESEYQQSQTNAQLSGSYIGLIQGRITENWHRPLSARNGMQAIVMIQLVPTGEVQNVYIIESSGDAAFDRSVIQAVQRAGKFEELQRLTPSQFNANFRKFRIIFKPEDLIR